MLDLNDVTPTPHYDLDALSAALARHADEWVPRYFKNGKRADGVIRLANIKGDAPRKQGSTIIQLQGANSGAWFDHTLGAGGGPLSTLQHATGLSGLPLLELAASLCGYSPEKDNPAGRSAGLSEGGNATVRAGYTPTATETVVQPAPEGNQKVDKAEQENAAAIKDARALAEIEHILAHSAEPAPDSTVGRYLASRGLTIPDCPDLLYCPNCTDYKTGTGRPAMIAVVRDTAGERIGLHRTYLEYDGSGKSKEMASPRKMLSKITGGAVRLAPPGANGMLGVAEGIETALSVTALFGVPCWAALSARNLADFTAPEGVRVVIFADKGEAGLEAARKLQARYSNTIVLEPRGNDDFNDDAIRKLWPEFDGSNDPGAKQRLLDMARIQREGLRGHNDQKKSPDSSETGIRNLPWPDPTKIRDRPQMPSDVVYQSGSPRGSDEAREPTPSATLHEAVHGLSSRSSDGGLQRPSNTKENGQDNEKLSSVPSIESKGEVRPSHWTDSIVWLRTKTGVPKPLTENVALAFEHAPEWQQVLGYDEFSKRMMLLRPPPWCKLNGHFAPRPWGDTDDTYATRWVQRLGIHAPSHIVKEALAAYAHDNAYHPVRQYVSANQWDSRPRLDIWLTFYLGATDTPYARAIGACFLISAVARIMQPGCQVDHMLILESPEQGIGKSTALRYLFRPWFADSISELSNKDSAIEVAGKWCIEFSELHAFKRSDKTALKSFVSRVSDHYVPKYGRHAIDQPRQCVFAGTGNEEIYLDDPTGARRFWPVRCTAIDLDALARDRDQLWAEAFARYNAGEKYYLTDETVIPAATEEQEARQQDDALAEPVIRWVKQQVLYDTSIGEVLEGIGIGKDRWDRGHQIRVGHVLRSLGWQRYRAAARDGVKQAWRYKRQVSQER